MKRILAAVLLIIGSGLSPAAAYAAAPTVPGHVPVQVDSSALTAATQPGPVVATGILTDAAGKPTAGTVAVLAWPNQETAKKVKIGASVSTPTIGWASVGPDGSFSVHIDRTKLAATYVNPSDEANLELVGWNSSSQATWSFPVQLPADTASLSAAVDAASTGPSSATPAVTLKLSQALLTAPTTQAPGAASGIQPAVVIPPYCVWELQSTYMVWADIGDTYVPPSWAATDKGGFTEMAGHTATYGAAVSASGSYGSWSVSGSASDGTSTTKVWTDGSNGSYSLYREQVEYGTWQCYVLGTVAWSAYESLPITTTGGFTHATASSMPSYGHSTPVDAGIWQRTSTSGYGWSMSAGVLIYSTLGINLSISENYSGSHMMEYSFSTNDNHLCGSNTYPSNASDVTDC